MDTQDKPTRPPDLIPLILSQLSNLPSSRRVTERGEERRLEEREWRDTEGYAGLYTDEGDRC